MPPTTYMLHHPSPRPACRWRISAAAAQAGRQYRGTIPVATATIPQQQTQLGTALLFQDVARVVQEIANLPPDEWQQIIQSGLKAKCIAF